jgi:hypothetical protein
MKALTLATAITALIGGLSLSGVAQADFDANFSRIDPDAASGDGASTVRNDCGGGTEGWEGATATIVNRQSGGTGKVKVRIKDGKPNTHFTVWVRLKGKSHGESFGGSPITGGGATPLAAGTELDSLVADWIGSGNPNGGANSFFTNHQGDGLVQIDTDFPLEGGAYPFNEMGAAALADAETKTGTNLVAAPTALANPTGANLASGTPFLIRVVSHCQDGESHGLSPSKREAWFQYP